MKTCRKPNRASAQSETTGPSGECRVCVLPPLASLETTQQSSRALARLASGRVLAAGVPMRGTRVDQQQRHAVGIRVECHRARGRLAEVDELRPPRLGEEAPRRSSSGSVTWAAGSGWSPTRFALSSRRPTFRTCPWPVPRGSRCPRGPPRRRHGSWPVRAAPHGADDRTWPQLAADSEGLVDKLDKLLDAARTSGVTVVHATYEGTQGGGHPGTARIWGCWDPPPQRGRPARLKL